MSGYYECLGRQSQADGSVISDYVSTNHSQGAWNAYEQHMAAATGLIAYELERFYPREQLRIGRISLDILGVIYAGKTQIRTKIIRAGKTIELIEVVMTTQDKNAEQKISIIARAWRMQMSDTHEVAHIQDERQLPSVQPWAMDSLWQGGFIQSLKTYSQNRQKGRGIVWLTSDISVVAGETTSDFVRLMGLVDCANGIVPSIEQTQMAWAFPNLDLQIHLYRMPVGQCLGLETVQQIGEDGIGLTSSVLHDELGAFGRSEQILTVRKLLYCYKVNNSLKMSQEAMS